MSFIFQEADSGGDRERAVTMRPTAVDGDSTERVDRRTPVGAWQDPKTWVGILTFLLALTVFVSSRISSQLSAIDSKLEGFTVSRVEQRKDIDSLKEEVSNLKKAASEQTAYNFEMSKSMTVIITLLRDRGVDNIPNPPQPRKDK